VNSFWGSHVVPAVHVVGEGVTRQYCRQVPTPFTRMHPCPNAQSRFPVQDAPFVPVPDCSQSLTTSVPVPIEVTTQLCPPVHDPGAGVQANRHSSP
jgi:hypothetical protein